MSQESLRDFGKLLHPLADSWSHQGIPGIPWFCHPQYAWAHPKKRGGWWSHDADLTWRHVQDTLETAQTAYHYLRVYLGKPPNGWDRLESQVAAFAKADSVYLKYRWFANPNNLVPLSSYKFECFWQESSLPSGGSPPCPRKRKVLRLKLNKSKQVHELGVDEFIHTFLENWIVRRDFNAALESIDIKSVTEKLAEGQPVREKIQDDGWVRVLLRMWLIRDHGVVNALGHGMPDDPKGYQYLADTKVDLAFKSLDEAITSPNFQEIYFLTPVMPPDGEPKQFAAVLVFQHAPSDTLAVVASRQDGIWKVTEFQWAITR